MNEISAIQTVYHGYKFRSRLEARWAVFFDTIGAKFEYEPEGFDLGKLGWYLPDFYVYEFGGGGYFEVKPNNKSDRISYHLITYETIHTESSLKLNELALKTNENCFLLNGPPDFEFYSQCHVHEGSITSWNAVGFCYDEYKYLQGTWIDPIGCSIEHMYGFKTEEEKRESFWNEYQKAVYSSRAARF